jgi:hypothetical protein
MLTPSGLRCRWAGCETASLLEARRLRRRTVGGSRTIEGAWYSMAGSSDDQGGRLGTRRRPRSRRRRVRRGEGRAPGDIAAISVLFSNWRRRLQRVIANRGSSIDPAVPATPREGSPSTQACDVCGPSPVQPQRARMAINPPRRLPVDRETTSAGKVDLGCVLPRSARPRCRRPDARLLGISAKTW